MDKKFKNIPLLVFSTTLLASYIIGYSSWLIFSEKTFNIENKVEEKPVAYIIGKETIYTSIEKALESATSGDIVTFIPPTKNNYHDTKNTVIPDKVTYRITRDCEIKPGVTLVVPTDKASTDKIIDNNSLNTYINDLKTDNRSRGSSGSYTKFAEQNKDKYLRTTVIVESGVTITNNGKLVVSGYLGGGTSNAGIIGQTCHSYSEILLDTDSKIVQNNSNAELHCYGYISELEKDNGSFMDVRQGKLFIPFVIDDYRGFSFSWAMTDGAINNHRCSPFNQFEMRNISVALKINYYAKVLGIANVYLTYSTLGVDHVFTETLTIVGNETSNFLQLTNPNDSYILYKFDTQTLVADIDIYGGSTLNSFSLNLSYSGVSVDLSTTNSYFPISYRFNVSLNKTSNQSSANYDATKQRIKLLPGTKFEVGEGCIFSGSELIVYSAFFDGSRYNGQSSFVGYSNPYPLKEGAILKANATSSVNCNYLAGTVYGDVSNFIYSNNSIISKEAWSIKSSGGIIGRPAWTISDFLEIRETLAIKPLSNINSNKLYVGFNTFTNYNAYLPKLKIYTTNVSRSYDVFEYQSVLIVDEIESYHVEFVENIYSSYCGTNYYKKDEVISYDGKSIYGAINSTLSISNNNNGVNEFDVQNLTINCVTPPIDGKIPLYVDKTITLEAIIVDKNKVYDKTVNWSSLNPDIATVDSNGVVTGKQLGKVIIQAECGGKIATYEAEVINSGEIIEIQSIVIVDNKGNKSDVIAGKGDFSYNGKYGNNANITFSININPSNAPYSSIEWIFTASMAGRQYINDKTQKTETIKNVNSVTVHTTNGTGRSDDKATLVCKVTDLNGKVIEEVFILNHEADVSCFLPGTLIMLSNGSYKKVEEVAKGDRIKVFNHFTGLLEDKELIFNFVGEEKMYDVMHLSFDDGSKISIVTGHAFYNANSNRYDFIYAYNCKKFIGNVYAKFDFNENKFKSCKLIDVKLETMQTTTYNPVSEYTINCFANDFLTMPEDNEGVIDIFEFDSNKVIDKERMNNEIEKYGLFEYEYFKNHIPYYIFDVLNMKYLKVSIGKGLITEKRIFELIDKYVTKMLEQQKM